MPSVPIDRPSLTPMVLKRRPTSPDAWTPSLMVPARRSRCMLHVLPSYHMLQMPTCGFCRSASVRPMPYSIAWDAPWLRGWVTRDEYLLATNDQLPTATALLAPLGLDNVAGLNEALERELLGRHAVDLLVPALRPFTIQFQPLRVARPRLRVDARIRDRHHEFQRFRV